ncbi:hypothetical protein GE061_014300 [Apolygus lucorum]|uniref:Major facilitator superfamily (MFS) profile domain-containing protein n=1 Tax=Apolygus lucorum TaxID=248454 RepID=A0A6A4KDV2_APOLU|nr:hypothetical protein GE061_014300 [Apolygus lucorum]
MAAVKYATTKGAKEEGRRLSLRQVTSLTSLIRPGGEEVEDSTIITKTYKKRWLMLGIFVLVTIGNSLHWLQYAIIAKAVRKFYRVSDTIIDLTGLMYSITFIAFVFPAIFMIEIYGLKWMLIFGDTLMIIGSWMKMASIKPVYFFIGFSGQVLVGISQCFIVNVTSYLAGIWFPPNEVSTACAIGVLGTQVGIAFGFIIPPLMVHDHHDAEQLKMEFCWLYVSFACLPTLTLPLLLFVFRSFPPLPPSLARAGQSTAPENRFHVFVDLMRNTNYNLMVISYSLSVATFYCISVLLDQLIAHHYEDETLSGISGLVLIICGIFGCFLGGWLMDKTHKFKLMAIVMYCLSLIGLGLFWVALLMRWYYVVIASMVIMGFFLVSYVIVAIEFSAEVTYPINETTSTSVLLMFGEVFTVIITLVSAELMTYYRTDTPVICTTGGFLVVGMVVTCCFRDVKLLRHQASIDRISVVPSKTLA